MAALAASALAEPQAEAISQPPSKVINLVLQDGEDDHNQDGWAGNRLDGVAGIASNVKSMTDSIKYRETGTVFPTRGSAGYDFRYEHHKLALPIAGGVNFEVRMKDGAFIPMCHSDLWSSIGCSSTETVDSKGNPIMMFIIYTKVS